MYYLRLYDGHSHSGFFIFAIAFFIFCSTAKWKLGSDPNFFCNLTQIQYLSAFFKIAFVSKL